MREKKPKPPTKTEIAKALGDRIHAHLVRIENNPKLNPARRFDREKKKWILDKNGLCAFYNAYATGDRHRVRVLYVLYQGSTALSIEGAQTYVEWLDAGNVGTHYQAGVKRV